MKLPNTQGGNGKTIQSPTGSGMPSYVYLSEPEKGKNGLGPVFRKVYTIVGICSWL